MSGSDHKEAATQSMFYSSTKQLYLLRIIIILFFLPPDIFNFTLVIQSTWNAGTQILRNIGCTGNIADLIKKV